MNEDLLEEGIKISGSKGFYQYVMTFILFLIGICTNLCYGTLFLMETPPEIEYFDTKSNSTIVSTLSYSHCLYDYKILDDKSKHSWVWDYNIFCDKFKVSLLGFCYCLGSTIGSYYLSSVLALYGAKKTFLLTISAYSVVCIILIINPYEYLIVLYICVVLLGMFAVPAMILKVNILSEISSTSLRPYLNNIAQVSGNFTLMASYFLIENNFHWKILYISASILLIVLGISFFLIATDSPRHLFSKNIYNKNAMITLSIIKIHYFNYGNKIDNGNETINTELSSYLTKIFAICSNEEKEIILDYINQNNINCIYLKKYKLNSNNSNNTSIRLEKEKESNLNIKHNHKLEILNEDTFYRPEENRLMKEDSFFISNYVITFGIIAYLNFLFNLTMKDYSHFFHSKLYFISTLGIIFTIPLSLLMNYIGRKGTKLLLIFFIALTIFFKESNLLSFGVMIQFFLFNKLLLSKISMIHHIHTNESFSGELRLYVSSKSFIVGKICSMISPFTIEYMHGYLDEIVIILCFISIYLISSQIETNKLELKENKVNDSHKH